MKHNETSFGGQQIHRTMSSSAWSSATSLDSLAHRHVVLGFPIARKPPGAVRVTKNEGSNNHPERLWGIASAGRTCSAISKIFSFCVVPPNWIQLAKQKVVENMDQANVSTQHF